MTPRLVPLLRRPTTLLTVAAALYIAGGGVIHLVEWLEVYRDVPASVPGAAVVRIGFPVNAAVSALLAAALVVTLFRFRRWAPVVAVGALAFEAAALAGLILSRVGSAFGWTEPVWNDAANQTRIVEIVALLALGMLLIAERQRRASRALALAVVKS